MSANPENPPPQTSVKPPWKRLLPCGLIALVIVMFFVLGLDEYLSFEALRDHREELLAWYEANQIIAIASFAILYALVVAFSVPGATWMTLAGGFMFGTVIASITIVISATV
jgi:uncharacterized membrane protein YdjX (TVP38/TMEM64 family)